ncbi:hypothetical protein GPECTOR_27g626 [Gonium pectorale]|uniref:Uncharacterized protein n=1 Tax=Gonium pectorale TaxID=33097 RepID=A0A150GF57_GONPE|nr:hypothetical protein GPECTOR_27g626 [Gonium pectorale]|eukprot:KXZ48456.1 hypothetical protein GPECTOR_27g626 [Gonium pectorale]
MRASMKPAAVRSSGSQLLRRAVPVPLAAPLHAAGSPRVVAAAAATTAWDSWSSYISKHRTDSAGAPTSKAEADWGREIAKSISSTATSFKPKYVHSGSGGGSAGSSYDGGNGTGAVPDFKLSHVGSININDLPRDLHERLEALASLQLKQALAKPDDELDAASISFTTTDVDGALCVSGVTLQQGLDKTALIAFVATETERQASWSRLEGLILHWGATDAAGGAWGLPPQGWAAQPNKVVDAGGAWQCGFEKQNVSGPEGNSAVYVLLLQVPLRGILKAGGLVFVLKATAGQNTRWLKDEATKKDFFLDTTRFPVIKV